MVLNGKERHFALTVGAYFDIAQICPEHDITMLGDLLSNDNMAMQTIIKMAVAMNKAYNDQRQWQGLETEGDSLTEAELYTMPLDGLKALSNEVMASYTLGSATEVEAKDSKKKER